MIDRTIFKTLENELKNEKITVITGARQIGKTTAMKYVYSKVKDSSNFITFDDENVKTLFENNIDLFVEQHIIPFDYIFIDEFQYVKEGGKKLKFIFDKTGKKMFISGSSKPEISVNSLKYLVGRVSLIEMYPLSFAEFLKFKSPNKLVLLKKIRTVKDLLQLKAEFSEFLMFGGYPEVVKEPNFDSKKKILSDLVEIYFLKEIKDVLGYKDSYKFENLLKVLASNNGKIINKSKISNILDIAWQTANEYLSVLSNTNVIYLLRPFHSNKSKEITKSPKIYFHDTGFLNSFLNNFSEIDLRIDKGEILENFVLHELIKNSFKPKFWNKRKSEVDFVIQRDQKIFAIECKSHNGKITTSLKNFISEYSPDLSVVLNLKNDLKHEKILITHYLNLNKLINDKFELD